MVLVLIAAVIGWVAAGGGPNRVLPIPASTAAAQPFIPAGTATDTPVARPTATTSADGLVTLDPAAAGPSAAAVLDLIDRHFSAINARDYSAWASTVVARRAADQPADTWRQNYRSTDDRSVVISSITATGPDSVDVALSFVSTQAVADAPADLPVGRICWQSRWPVVSLGAGGLIDVPPPGTTTHTACG